MPNHITNRLTILGTSEQAQEVFEKFSTHFPSEPHKSYDDELIYKNSEGGWGYLNEETQMFTRRNHEPVEGVPEGYELDYTNPWTRFPDFEKVVPCPPELHIESNGDLMALDNKFSYSERFKDVVDTIRNAYKEAETDKAKEWTEERIKNFLQGIENYIRHGHSTWYSWNIENWGTKWNAYDCDRPSDNVFEWDTAWSGVPQMVMRISEAFPELVMEYIYADEDTGSNVGRFKFKGGKIIDNTSPSSGSNEAYELAFELKPDNKKYYRLEFGSYVYHDEEE